MRGEQNSNQSETEETFATESKHSKKKFIYLALVLTLIIGASGGGYAYYSKVKSAQNEYAAGCIRIFPEITKSFNEYRNAGLSASFFGEEGSSANSALASMRRYIGTYRSLSERLSVYAGASATLDSLDLLTKQLQKFVDIKSKQLRIVHHIDKQIGLEIL